MEKGAILGLTVYKDGKLCGRDIPFTLPAITWQTMEFKASGTMELPLYGLTDNLSASITKNGLSDELTKLCLPGTYDLEIRFVQASVNTNGKQKEELCRAYMRVCPMGIPGADGNVGETSENQIDLSVLRYQLFVADKEAILIDKIKGQCRINGTDSTGVQSRL